MHKFKITPKYVITNKNKFSRRRQVNIPPAMQKFIQFPIKQIKKINTTDIEPITAKKTAQTIENNKHKNFQHKQDNK